MFDCVWSVFIIARYIQGAPQYLINQLWFMYIVTESTQRNMGPNSSNLPCVYILQDQCVHLCMSYLNEDCQMGPKHNEKKNNISRLFCPSVLLLTVPCHSLLTLCTMYIVWYMPWVTFLLLRQKEKMLQFFCVLISWSWPWYLGCDWYFLGGGGWNVS